jgi:hypothetical protein
MEVHSIHTYVHLYDHTSVYMNPFPTTWCCPTEYRQAYVQAYGWTDGRTDGWTDGRTDGRTDGWTDGRMDGWMDRQTDNLTDRQTDNLTDRRTDEADAPSHINPSTWDGTLETDDHYHCGNYHVSYHSGSIATAEVTLNKIELASGYNLKRFSSFNSLVYLFIYLKFDSY